MASTCGLKSTDYEVVQTGSRLSDSAIDRRTVDKMLAFSAPPGYRRKKTPARPKLDPYVGIIDQMLEDDSKRLKKQRHTSKRIFERPPDVLSPCRHHPAQHVMENPALKHRSNRPDTRLHPTTASPLNKTLATREPSTQDITEESRIFPIRAFSEPLEFYRSWTGGFRGHDVIALSFRKRFIKFLLKLVILDPFIQRHFGVF